MCHNFKDPSVQLYGGDSFKHLQDEADNAFCSIPAPKPSIRPYPDTFQASAPANMHNYLDYNAGCFDGEGIVMLSNGKKRVKELVKGDLVVCGDGKLAKVVALITTKLKGEIEIVTLNEVKLTCWHPIRLNGEWKFPIEVKSPSKEHCDAVYNLVLDRNHIVVINDLEVVTLGHGFKDNVVEHG